MLRNLIDMLVNRDAIGPDSRMRQSLSGGFLHSFHPTYHTTVLSRKRAHPNQQSTLTWQRNVWKKTPHIIQHVITTLEVQPPFLIGWVCEPPFFLYPIGFIINWKEPLVFCGWWLTSRDCILCSQPHSSRPHSVLRSYGQPWSTKARWQRSKAYDKRQIFLRNQKWNKRVLQINKSPGDSWPVFPWIFSVPDSLNDGNTAINHDIQASYWS